MHPENKKGAAPLPGQRLCSNEGHVAFIVLNQQLLCRVCTAKSGMSHRLLARFLFKECSIRAHIRLDEDRSILRARALTSIEPLF